MKVTTFFSAFSPIEFGLEYTRMTVSSIDEILLIKLLIKASPKIVFVAIPATNGNLTHLCSCFSYRRRVMNLLTLIRLLDADRTQIAVNVCINAVHVITKKIF